MGAPHFYFHHPWVFILKSKVVRPLPGGTQYKSSTSAELLYIPRQSHGEKSCQTSFNLCLLYPYLFRVMTPSARVGDAMTQMQKYKGGTAKQGLLSLLATSHCYTIWPGKSIPPSEMESNSSSKSLSKLTSCLVFLQGSDLSWPIPRDTMCHHQIAVLAQKFKTTRLCPCCSKL